MRRGRTLAGLLVLAIAAAGAAPAPRATKLPAVAGTAPAAALGYAGRWILDTAKSEMGKRLPRSREDRMREQGAWMHVNSLTIRANGDTLRLDYRYRLDGGESVNRVLGQDVKTRGRREGTSLRFDSEAQLALFKFTVNEQWTLSRDGGTLTQERTSRSPMGDEKQKLVFGRAR